MKMIRITASVAASLLATLGLILGLMSTNTSSVQRTIDNSRKIEASLKQAAVFVDAHIMQTGHTPTSKEFEAWAEGCSSRSHMINSVHLDLPPYTSDFTTKHGQPPSNGYVLSYWRGEWEERYVSWKKQSSLVFERSAYFMFGSSLAQGAAGIALALSMGFAAIKLWSRRPHAHRPSSQA